jgi:hypothetical protein
MKKKKETLFPAVGTIFLRPVSPGMQLHRLEFLDLA